MIIFDDCLRIICDTPITPEYLWIPFEPRVVFTLPPCLPPHQTIPKDHVQKGPQPDSQCTHTGMRVPERVGSCTGGHIQVGTGGGLLATGLQTDG